MPTTVLGRLEPTKAVVNLAETVVREQSPPLDEDATGEQMGTPRKNRRQVLTRNRLIGRERFQAFKTATHRIPELLSTSFEDMAPAMGEHSNG